MNITVGMRNAIPPIFGFFQARIRSPISSKLEIRCIMNPVLTMGVSNANRLIKQMNAIVRMRGDHLSIFSDVFFHGASVIIRIGCVFV